MQHYQRDRSPQGLGLFGRAPTFNLPISIWAQDTPIELQAPTTRTKEDQLRSLVRRTLRCAIHACHLLETTAPGLWARAQELEPYGITSALQMLQHWTNNKTIDFAELEDLRGRFAEQLDCLRHVEYDLDGDVLYDHSCLPASDQSIIGLIGSGFLILLTVASYVLVPIGELPMKDLCGRIQHARQSFTQADTRRELLVRLYQHRPTLPA